MKSLSLLKGIYDSDKVGTLDDLHSFVQANFGGEYRIVIMIDHESMFSNLIGYFINRYGDYEVRVNRSQRTIRIVTDHSTFNLTFVYMHRHDRMVGLHDLDLVVLHMPHMKAMLQRILMMTIS